MEEPLRSQPARRAEWESAMQLGVATTQFAAGPRISPVQPPRDPAAIAQRLELLAFNAQMRDTMGAKARQVFLERHTVEAYLEAMEEALSSAAAFGA